MQRFEYGSIVWSPRLGAFWLSRLGARAWDEYGGPAGSLGYPRNDCQPWDEAGQICIFQHGNVWIETSRSTYWLW